VSAEDGSSGFRCGRSFLRVAIGIVSRDVVSMPIVAAVRIIPAGIAAIAWEEGSSWGGHAGRG